jgi:hypothetical protein
MKTIKKFTAYKLGNVESKNVFGGGAAVDALTNRSIVVTIGKQTYTYEYNGYTGEETWTAKF